MSKVKIMIENLKSNFFVEKLRVEYGVTDLDKVLIRQALTHKSFSKERYDIGEVENYDIDCYQRLELFGDKVLGLVVTEYIYKKYPEMSEGEISRLLESYVNNNHLAGIAQKLEVEEYLFLGTNQLATDTKILADSFEAIIGAIFLSSGISVVSEFINVVLLSVETGKEDPSGIDNTAIYMKTSPFSIPTVVTLPNAKNTLQEFCQGTLGNMPEYITVDEWGPDHQKSFKVEVWISDKLLGEGTANKKKDAEKVAALEACKYISNLDK